MARGDWKILAILALCESCLFFVCVTYAMRYTTASEAGVIAANLPIFIALGARFILKEKMGKRVMIGAIVTMAGICGMNVFAVGSATALAGECPDAGRNCLFRRLHFMRTVSGGKVFCSVHFGLSGH